MRPVNTLEKYDDGGDGDKCPAKNRHDMDNVDDDDDDEEVEEEDGVITLNHGIV